MAGSFIRFQGMTQFKTIFARHHDITDNGIRNRLDRIINPFLPISSNDQAVLIFCVQHTGVSAVSPADLIYPAYGAALREARAAGVEVLAYGCQIEKHQLRVSQPLAVRL